MRESTEYRNKCIQREALLQQAIRASRSRLSNAREARYVDEIRNWQHRMLQLHEENIALLQKATDIIAHCLGQFGSHVATLVSEGQLPVNALEPAEQPSNLTAASQHIVSGGGSAREAAGIRVTRAHNHNNGGTPAIPRLQLRSNKRLKIGHLTTSSTSSVGSYTTKPAKRVVGEHVGGNAIDEDEDSSTGEDADWKVYCYCQQGSDGHMVRCGDEECPYKWFHLRCLPFVEEPEMWYCLNCEKKLVMQLSP